MKGSRSSHCGGRVAKAICTQSAMRKLQSTFALAIVSVLIIVAFVVSTVIPHFAFADESSLSQSASNITQESLSADSVTSELAVSKSVDGDSASSKEASAGSSEPDAAQSEEQGGVVALATASTPTDTEDGDASAPTAHVPAMATREAVPGSVRSEDELIAAIEAAPTDGSKTTVSIAGDFELTKQVSLVKGQNITLTDDGSAHTIVVNPADRAGSHPAIEVAAGSTLSVQSSTGQNDLLTFTGVGTDKGQVVCLIKTAGTLYWHGATVRNFYFGNVAKLGLIIVEGADASMTLDEGLFTDNVGGYFAGVLTAEGSGSLTINGGTIQNNTVDFYVGGSAPVYISARDSTLEHPTRFTMNGGLITENIGGMSGGVFVGNTQVYQKESAHGRAIGTINGGTISSNKAHMLGGGVAVVMNAELTLNGGTISHNQAANLDSGTFQRAGGGVGVYDWWVNGYDEAFRKAGLSAEQIQSYWDNTWRKQAPAKFIMNGGTIKNNYAADTGGGIYAASGEVYLNGGEILGNSAGFQGGGIYVPAVPYVTHITSGLVTKNSASKLGGGIWSCPTGDVRVLLNNTAALFDNTAEGAGNDVVSLSQDGGTYELHLSDRILGGGRITWYKDGAVAKRLPDDSHGTGNPSAPRYSDERPTSAYEGAVSISDEDLALHGKAEEASRKAASDKATLVISGNKAPYGAGIGTNGSVIIGQEDTSVDVTVKKEWSAQNDTKKAHPKSVQIKLLRDGVWIETATLNEQNGWSWTFKGLPEHKDGYLDTKSVYSVEEVVPEGYNAQVTGSAEDGFTVTNTPVAPPERPTPEIPERPTPERPTPERPTPERPTPERPVSHRRLKSLPQTSDVTAQAALVPLALSLSGVGLVALLFGLYHRKIS